MNIRVDEIASRIYRLSTFVPEIGPTGFTFNQFLLDDDEPLLFHTGHRSMFPAVREAIERIVPVERLRWIMFGHVESDECGAMNDLLAVAPAAEVAHGALGCMVSIAEMADRAPRPLPMARSRARCDARPPHRHAPRPARVGSPSPLRGDDRHAAVRRPLHPSGRWPRPHRATTSSAPPPKPKMCSATPA